MAAGALGVLLSAAVLALVLALRKVTENAFWIPLGAFSLMSLALIAVGRSGFGEELFAQAMLSRYAAFSALGVVALYGLLASLAVNARSRLAVGALGILVVATAAGVAHSYPRGMEAGRATEESRRHSASILAAHKSEPLAPFTIFGHDPNRVRRHARFLDRHDYSVFARNDVGVGEEAKVGSP